MISRRLSALTLSLLAFAGCHEDPTVESVLVQPSTEALTLSAAGGAASSTAGTDGVGGVGGDFLVTAKGLISLGSPAFIPAVPAIPAVPTITSTALTTPVLTTSTVGSILISGSVITGTASPIVLTSSNGDIVVSGTLQSGVLGSVLSDIQLVAPNGTVYVTGTIRTAGDDAALDGKAGGNLTIDAARVVITGTIDTHGVADNTGASNGGKGGDVDIKASKAPIYFTAGSIVTTGGSAVDMTGGAGGFVHMNSAAPVNAVHVFAPITTNGGEGTGTTPTGGQAGNVVIQGAGEINLLGGLSMQGGAANGTSTNAAGGVGGSLSVDGPAVCRIYGSVLVTGGAASASTAGGTVTGGNGGDVLLGQAAGGLNSVELGSGTYTQAGGTGGRSVGIGGGAGGTVTIESIDGDVTIASSLSVAGGAGTGTGNAGGGLAGAIQIRTDAQASGNLSNHVLSIASLASLLDASGGAAQGSGVGGAGGTVLLQSGGDLTCGARILASGGASVSGTGGSAAAGAVILQVTAVNLVGSGDLVVTGEITAAGGVVTTGGIGGNGADVTAQVLEGNGILRSSAKISTTGSNGGTGDGGTSGNILLHAGSGDLELSGTLTVSGSSSPTTPKAAGNITLESSGILTSSAVLNAIGGASTDATGAAIAKNGGAILFDGKSAFSSVTLLAGSSLLADGGATTGVAVTTVGGAGGTITLRTLGQNIDMSGSILARGGAGSGTTTGGPGGRVLVVSDFSGTGISGNITLESGGLIDVSGGSGSVLGPAIFNPGPPADPDPTVALPTTLAVAFDADKGTSATGGTNPGRITNLGSIVATGSTGGDVWWNGLNSLGVALTPADNTGITVTGTVAGHFYPH